MKVPLVKLAFRLRSAVALLGLALSACLPTKWGAGPTTFASEAEVAHALGDGPVATEAFDPKSLVDFAAPLRVRPCCAFGMDLKVKVASVHVPGYSNGNILGVEGIGRHEYNNGSVTLQSDLTRLVGIEKNGLVYTCRGGFVDTAHVRDNADLTLYLTNRIVAALPQGEIIKLDGDGAVRRIILKPVPPQIVERVGRWETAVALAQHAAFQLSIWHEISTFYGMESVPGFSEKVSAFSPEDLYSNVVGARLAGGILLNHRVHTRAEWDALMDAWIKAGLQRLGALPADLGRRAMHTVDGRWWTSQRELPDWTLVLKRQMDIRPHVVPWRLADASAPQDEVMDAACAARPKALPLDVPDRIDGHPITDFVTVDFEVGAWAPAAMPFADASIRHLTSADFPRFVEAVRAAAEPTLGRGFDNPGVMPAEGAGAARANR
ncbi:MAG: DUF4056 domain-containing protein [Minicystis sp.]